MALYDDAVDAKAVLDSARGKYQAVIKRAGNLGINAAALKRAIAEAARDRDKREIDDRDFRRYMAWLSMPLGSQGDFFTEAGGDPEANGQDETGDPPDPTEAGAEASGEDGEDEERPSDPRRHAFRVAYRDGVTAGRAGSNPDSNPHAPGSEEAQNWRSGWSEGQSEKVHAEIAPTARRGRQQQAVAPSSEAI
ncbi:MAG TPA: hypothetical protein VNF04_03415 [Stellaceae bacterium]|nr:hypothetical protein [Stellaceae bacterium]